ncbi:hypothetical protein CF326_g7962 [Tilletia indica]|nr:hypothetical protein CF326_g7962 [Tilletia indica]
MEALAATKSSRTKADKIREVHDTMRRLDLSFSDFIEGYLGDTDAATRRSLSNWAFFSPDRCYGPVRLLRSVGDYVLHHASKDGIKHFQMGLLDIGARSMEGELAAAVRTKEYTSAAAIDCAHRGGQNQVQLLAKSFALHLPLLSSIIQSLCDTRVTAASANDSEDSDDEVTNHISDEAEESGTSKQSFKELIQVVTIALIMRARSNRLNRFQAFVGLMLRFQHAPKSVQTFLNRLGISTSRSSSSRHLKILNTAAEVHARTLMEGSSRIKVLLFDNVDIYLQSRHNRITASSQLVNLTMRTLLRLPETYQSHLITSHHLRSLDGPRELSINQLEGDGGFLRRMAFFHIAKEIEFILASRPKASKGPLSAARRLIAELEKGVSITELAAEKWDFAPLTLLEENEGSIEGTLAILEDTAATLGIVQAAEQPEVHALDDLPAHDDVNAGAGEGSDVASSRVDTSHGAAFAVDRLRDTYSATAEVARSMRRDHAMLLDERSSGRAKRLGYVRDIERIASLAERDGLFEHHTERVVDEHQTDTRKRPFFGPDIPRAHQLLAASVVGGHKNDILETGFTYCARVGLKRWSTRRGAGERYEALIGPEEEGHSPPDDDDGGDEISEQRDGDVEDAPGIIQRRETLSRRKEWERRQEEVILELDVEIGAIVED